MFFKKLPLSIILVFTIIGSGFFYAQEIPSQYICPRGDAGHRGFICQCANPNIQFDSISIKQIRLQGYCPRGIHNFICQCTNPRTKIDSVIIRKIHKFKHCPQGIHDSFCQCGPARFYHDKKFIVVKKQKRIRRIRKSHRLQQ
jgi:hypothetical protein